MNTSFYKFKYLFKINAFLLLTISSLVATQSQAQKFHKWVDKNGSTHYTLTPPPTNAKRLGQIATYDDTPRESNPSYIAPESQPQNDGSSSTVNVQIPHQQSDQVIPLPQVQQDPTAGQRF